MDNTDILITIGISGGVGLIIMYFQRKLEGKVDKLIEKQHKIIEDEHKREEDWKETWGNRIIIDLNATKSYYEILRRWLIDYMNNRSNVSRENLIFSAERLGITVDYFVQNINEHLPKIENYLKDPLLSTQLKKQSIQFSTPFKILSSDWIWEDGELNGQIFTLDSMIKMLNDGIERMKKELSKFPSSS